MVTMTASQPEPAAAEIQQQQAKSNFMSNCNYIRMLECDYVCDLVSFFPPQDLLHFYDNASIRCVCFNFKFHLDI